MVRFGSTLNVYMKRIGKIEQALRELDGPGISASELAEKLDLSRANVSSDLNRLVMEGIAVKSGTKPVYYSITGPQKDPEAAFDLFLRNNNSLFQCGELARAAVLYPPHGMHIMLFGETGVGKSMFAKMIFEYALARRTIPEDASFVTFNCADYANNPQLLLSQLFGVSKGAYTGADSNRPGLLEQADGGILFLDEVHRLPPEGQEMLFSYIDHGSFRRLGETSNTRTVTVQLICATTENTGSNLLRTFIRRIPMQIKMPNLEERNIEERYALVNDFFTSESKRLESPVLVSVNSLRALLGYNCTGNVGQLESDIQLLCARAYSDFISQKKESICISSYDLPSYIRNGIFAEKNRKKIWGMLAGINTRFISFTGAEISVTEEGANLFKTKDIYDIIERRTGEMNRVGASRQQIDEVMGEIMADYYNGFSTDTGIPRMESFVGTEIVSTVDKMLEIAARELGRNFDAKLRYGLSLHLNNAIQRTLQGLPITNPRLDSIQNEWPEILAVAQKMLTLIEQDFNIRLPLDEAGFITLFLVPKDGLAAKILPIEVIVIAHGRGIATGLAETANRLLDADIIRGFDVTLDESQSETYQKVKTYLEQQKNISGVLFLVDMGSLVNYAYEFEQELRIHTMCISMVSTLHVLEAGRKALMGYSLEDVYESTRQLTARVSSENYNTLPEGFSQKNFLLTVCTTGEGSAQVLKSYLSKKLDLKDGLCSIIPLQITDTQEFKRQVERLRAAGRIIGTISALPVNISVPQFQLSTALTPEGICEIQKLIDTETVFIQVCRNMANTLTGFKNSIAWEIRNMMDRIKENLRTEMDSDMLIGIFCHIGCTLDRIKSGVKVLEFPKKQTIAEKYPRELGFIRRECAGLSKLCGMNIPTDEAYYILILFKKENWL